MKADQKVAFAPSFADWAQGSDLLKSIDGSFLISNAAALTTRSHLLRYLQWLDKMDIEG